MARKKSLDLGPVLHEQILRSASTLFDERGYSGASIRDIAAAVGISSSTMYHLRLLRREDASAVLHRQRYGK